MRVLIVDDSRAMRMLLGNMMSRLGFDALFAGHGVEALDVIAREGRPDVVLVDWNMPEMNGFELLVALRGDTALDGMPVVMVTSETELPQLVKALEAGASEYVMKPFTIEILRDKLDMLGLLPVG